MSRPLLSLDADELWTAFELINPVDVVADELIGRVIEHSARARRLATWPDEAGTERVILEDPGTGIRCVLPADGLRSCRTAALCALAARQLLLPTVITATVLGTSRRAQLQLATIARLVPDISHIAVSTTPAGRARLEPRVLDQVDLSGIGLSVGRSMVEAVLGANLVVVADPHPWPLDTGLVPKGAVLVNAGGQDLPEDLVNHVDQIFVDDRRLIAACLHRYVVKMHLAGPEPVRPRLGNGWYRRPRIDADLGQVLTGAHPGRGHIDDVLLVELLGAGTLDAPLAAHLCRVARERGLGTSQSTPTVGNPSRRSN